MHRMDHLKPRNDDETCHDHDGLHHGLRGIDLDGRSRLALMAAAKHVEAKQPIFYQGDAADTLYEVLSGAVKLYKLLPDGRRLVTGFFFAGDIIGLSLRQTYAYTAEAITDAGLRPISRSRLERVMHDNPGMAKRLLECASDELEQAHEQMVLLGRKTPVEKVCSFLLAIARRQSGGHDIEDRETAGVRLPMPRADIADYLGLTVETVCRVLSRLKREGLITVSHARDIGLVDMDGLAAYADGDEPLTAAPVERMALAG